MENYWIDEWYIERESSTNLETLMHAWMKDYFQEIKSVLIQISLPKPSSQKSNQ